MSDENKPVGRPPKMDLSYVKLEIFEDGSNVDDWVRRAKECVKLKRISGDEAAGYVLYHIHGAAKLEICLEPEAVTDLNKIFTILRTRSRPLGTKGERLKELVTRRQLEGETIMEIIRMLMGGAS